MQNILLFLHGGSLNRGCEAIVRTCVSEIKRVYPYVKIDLASYQPETDTHIPQLDNAVLHHQKQPTKYSWSWLKSAFFVKFFKDERPFHHYVQKDIISKIKDYDTFFSIGGDNYCYGEQPGFYEINRLIKKSGKKLILWGASIGEEDLSPNKIEDLKRFDLVFARESLTFEVLKKMGLKNVKLVADGAFLMDKQEQQLPENFEEKNTIGINVSPLIFGKNPQAKTAVKELIKHILETTNFKICLVPHVTVEISNDYLVLQEIFEEFKNSERMILLADHLDATQLKGYISKMKFFIGARTHATIAAYSTSIPTLVLGYSIKSKGIAKDIFGEEKLVLDINEISNSKNLIAAFEEMKSDEQNIKEILKIRIPEIQKISRKAVEYLEDIL